MPKADDSTRPREGLRMLAYCGRGPSAGAATATSGWLHGLVDDGQQFGAEGIQVDLVAEAGGELLPG